MPNPILSDEEIDSIPYIGKLSESGLRDFARCVESAVLAKLSEAEPVAYLHTSNRTLTWPGKLTVVQIASGAWTPLYASPNPTSEHIPPTSEHSQVAPNICSEYCAKGAGDVDERAAFEEWVNNAVGSSFSVRRPDGRYVWDVTERDWRVWQARASLSAVNQSVATELSGNSGELTPSYRDERQLVNWLLTDPLSGEPMFFASLPEIEGSWTRVRLRSKNGSDWTLTVKLSEGWLTADERKTNLMKAIQEEIGPVSGCASMQQSKGNDK